MQINLRRDVLILSTTLHLVFLISVILSWVGLELPLLRQSIGFLDLAFLPGILLLHILNVRLSGIETILYSVGVSLSLLMLIGFLMNLLYFVGISRPISETPLLTTITIIIFSFCFIYYFKRNTLVEDLIIEPKLSALSLSLLHLPPLAIFGAYLFNLQDDNKLLLLLIAVIALASISLTLFDKFSNLYPLAIWVISISLLLHFSLISMYVAGDTHTEYLYSNLVKVNGFWEHSFPESPNSLLIITMVLPIFSILLDIEITWIIKVIYPLIYSLVPLGLYIAFERQVGNKTAFLSCLLFMFYFPFYTVYPYNIRTGFGEYFLTLLILLMIDNKMESLKRRFLLVIFAFSLVVSYYGLSSFFMFIIIFALFFTLLIWRHREPYNRNVIVTPTFALLFIAISLSWYIYNSSSIIFNTFISFIYHNIKETLSLFNSETSYVLHMARETISVSIQVLKSLIFTIVLLMFLGVLDLGLKLIFGKIGRLSCYTSNSYGFNYEYVTLSFSCFLAVCIGFLPARAFSVGRLLHMSLLFLAPFCVLGWVRIIEGLDIITKKCLTNKDSLTFIKKNGIKIFSIFLALLLLFGSGFISETIIKERDFSPNALISKGRYTSLSEDAQFLLLYNRQLYLERNIFSAAFLSKYKSGTDSIYTVNDFEKCTLTSYGMIQPKDITLINAKTLEEFYPLYSGYVYLGKVSCYDKKAILISPRGFVEGIYDLSKLHHCLNTYGNKIYSNGESEIYYH